MFQVCSSYPAAVVVPKVIPDEIIIKAATFRQNNRFPVLCYLHKNGSVLLRSGQPLVGPSGKRCKEDEKLINSVLGPGKRGYIIDTRNQTLAQTAKVGFFQLHSTASWISTCFSFVHFFRPTLNVRHLYSLSCEFFGINLRFFRLCCKHVESKLQNSQLTWFSGSNNSIQYLIRMASCILRSLNLNIQFSFSHGFTNTPNGQTSSRDQTCPSSVCRCMFLIYFTFPNYSFLILALCLEFLYNYARLRNT